MILTSEQLEQIIKEETEAALREVDMKKIGQGIKQTVGKLKKKRAEPVRQKTPEEHYEEAIALVPEKAWGVGFAMNPQIAREQALDQATDYNNYKYGTPYHEVNYDITMPSGQKKRLTILYKNEPMNEIDMKKIGQGIKKTVGKLKKKPAEPAPQPAALPPLPPEGFHKKSETGVYEYRKNEIYRSLDDFRSAKSSGLDSGPVKDALRRELINKGVKDTSGIDAVHGKLRQDHDRGIITVQWVARWKPQRADTAAGIRQRAGLEEGIIGSYDVAEVLKDLATSALRGKWKKAPGASAYYVPYGDIDPRIDLPTMNMKKQEALANINKRLKYYLDRGDIKGAAENLKKWLYGDVRQWGYTGQGQLADHPAAEKGSRAPMLPLAWSVAYEAYSALV